MDPKNKYTKMQQDQYDNDAIPWTTENRNPVVGMFDEHNSWPDYDTFLFKGTGTQGKIALDFGCGPGRNIVKFANQFSRIDGTDISDLNLINADKWVGKNKIPFASKLYKTNGVDLSLIDSDVYDIVFSTICLQHICVHDIRFSLMKEFFRVLKPGGKLCLQMGYGKGHHPRTVGYYDNFYDAPGTNSFYDTRVDSHSELESDLTKIGFQNFDFDLRPPGPGDSHANWIFFRADKP
jgi:ubiquinone/menaquinone biosynthesis C-methylase UbiE